MKTRIYFLDNLRTFLVFLVVVLHAGIVYEPILESTWIVSDPVKNSSIGLIRMYLDLFIMFGLFFISGYFIPASLQNQTNLGFLKSKFKRIMLPWIVAVLTLIPLYKAIFLYSRGFAQEEWFSYFHFFERAGGNMFFYADNPTQNWLWFLPVLFIFQLVYLLLSKTKALSVRISLKKAVMLILILGVIYSMTVSALNLTGWFHSSLVHFQRERLLIYFMVFLFGSLCYKQKVFESDYNRRYYILSNVVLTISLSVFTVLALNLFFNMVDPGRNYFYISATIDRLVYYVTLLLSMFSFLHILLHVFRNNFNRTNYLLSQLSRNSYYVYIIHVVIIGLIALILKGIVVPAFVKYLILASMAFIVSNVLVSGFRGVVHKAISWKPAIAMVSLVLILGLAFDWQDHAVNADDQRSKTGDVSRPLPGISLHEAILKDDIETVKQYIRACSDLDDQESSAGSSPLITAAVFGRTEAARLLIEAGADVNLKNKEGSTALHAAAFFCHPEIVTILLDNGADISIRNNNGSTAYESVAAPFVSVKGIYEHFEKNLGPLGLEMDLDEISKIRPELAELLRKR